MVKNTNELMATIWHPFSTLLLSASLYLVIFTFTIIFLGVPPYPPFDPVLAYGAPACGRPSLNLWERCALWRSEAST